MTITLGALEISAATDMVRFLSQKISARVETVAPLRGSSGQPRSRGGAAVDWQIEVTRLHANRAAAETYMAARAAAVRDAVTHADASVSLNAGARGTYTYGAIVDVEIRDGGLTTVVVWTLRSAA